MRTSMLVRVCAFLAISAGFVFAANAETKTWTGGAGDGKWLTAGNWSPEGVPASTDTVTVNIPANSEEKTITITYEAGSDFTIASGGSLTLGENVTWVQSGGNAWWKIQGALTLEKGAQMQRGTAGGTKFESTASITLKEGSLIQVKRPNADWKVGTWNVNGTVELNTSDSESFTAEAAQSLATFLNLGEKGRVTNIKEIQWEGTAELSIDGTLSFGGFTAQSKGTRGDNVLTLKKGTYVFQKSTSTSLAGVVTYAPADTADYGTWVDVPSKAKVELVFADSSITAANVYEQIKDCSKYSAYNVIRQDGKTFANERAFKKAFSISSEADGVHVKPKGEKGLILLVR